MFQTFYIKRLAKYLAQNIDKSINNFGDLENSRKTVFINGITRFLKGIFGKYKKHSPNQTADEAILKPFLREKLARKKFA